MRIGPSAARQSYKTRLAVGDAHKISTDIRPILPPPFYRGQNARKIWPKFRPQSSSDRRIFELRRFIGKQKQTCQGPMIGLPPHQTWGKWVPQLPEPLAQWVPQRVKLEISYISSVPAAHAEYTATNVIPPIGAVADVKSLPCHISLFAPYISQGAKISPH